MKMRRNVEGREKERCTTKKLRDEKKGGEAGYKKKHMKENRGQREGRSRRGRRASEHEKDE
jgi:hypothetical protein